MMVTMTMTMTIMVTQVRWGVANTRQFLQQLAALGRDVSACSERVAITFTLFYFEVFGHENLSP